MKNGTIMGKLASISGVVSVAWCAVKMSKCLGMPVMFGQQLGQ